MQSHHDALAHIRQGDWEAAHELVQPHDDTLSCLIHALVHRQEGDLTNASYWYRRAGESLPDNTIDEELARLEILLKKEEGS